MRIRPKTIQEQGCKERPASYCCKKMRYAVEEMGYLQYEERERQYIFVDDEGWTVVLISYCPFCATHLPSLGDLMDSKCLEYVAERKVLTGEEFDRHWLIIREDLPFEETMRLIAEERAKEEAGEGC